jgi:hypothetical protein
MLSTKTLSSFPDQKTIQKICKSVSVLDAILCQDWEFRYFSYQSDWAEYEEFCEIRNSSGDHTLILFREDGCVINGYSNLYGEPDKEKTTALLPPIFNDFIFGEPVNTIGTTFCVWKTDSVAWISGNPPDFEDESEAFLFIFDGNPQTYLDWATDYFDGDLKESGIPLETVKAIYEGKILTKAMVLSLVDDLEDWEQLIADLAEIDYPHTIKVQSKN